LIKQAGGVAVIAHPLASLRGRTVSIDSFKSMVEAGLDGIEISHRDQSEDERELLREVVAEYGIIATGSSDYHGNGKLNELAEFTTKPEDFENLESRADSRRVVRK
jgi:predicted metal-dependent phosphoesterase TrpH